MDDGEQPEEKSPASFGGFLLILFYLVLIVIMGAAIKAVVSHATP
jgi:uncharacterized BrkB/YihY/UPF0761 family membrane protein